MKNRIFKNWHFMRFVYLVFGLIILVQSLDTKQWLGIVFSGYFLLMAIFGVGCAGGNCYTGFNQKTKPANSETEFEEIKYWLTFLQSGVALVK
jgi:hypothetical protein